MDGLAGGVSNLGMIGANMLLSECLAEWKLNWWWDIGRVVVVRRSKVSLMGIIWFTRFPLNQIWSSNHVVTHLILLTQPSHHQPTTLHWHASSLSHPTVVMTNLFFILSRSIFIFHSLVTHPSHTCSHTHCSLCHVLTHASVSTTLFFSHSIIS